MRKTTAVLNGRDKAPTQEELEAIWLMMEASVEDGWLRPDHIGNVDQELDEDDLRKLLKSNTGRARDTFGYFNMFGPGGKLIEHNFPEHMCGYYLIKRGTYIFVQWGAAA